MRLSKHKPPGTLAFNITPMIDIVFLLIIFFMTVSQITRTVESPLPLPRVAQGDEEKVSATVVINMTDEGTIVVAGNSISLDPLMDSMVNQIRQEQGDPNRIRIQLRVHRKCPSRYVTALLKRLSALGFTNVRSAVAD